MTNIAHLPLISVIVPTKNRKEHLNNIINYFNSQTYSPKEILIYDDSDSENIDVKQRISDNFKYFYSSKKISIGEKRNRLIKQAK